MDLSTVLILIAVVGYVAFIIWGIVASRRDLKAAKAAQLAASFENWICVHFEYGKENLDEMFAAQEQLERIVNTSGLGEVDGNEIAPDLSNGSLWIICSDIKKVLVLIKPTVLSKDFLKVTAITKREAAEEDYTTIWNQSESDS